MKQSVTILVLFLIIAIAMPYHAFAFQLVPCGTSTTQPCTFIHLVTLLIRMINYLISVAAIIAMYQVLSSGFAMVTALGDPEKIQGAKTGISNAIVGLLMIIMAFVFVNLLVNYIFSRSGGMRRWWDPDCVFNINTCIIPKNEENTPSGQGR